MCDLKDLLVEWGLTKKRARVLVKVNKTALLLLTEGDLREIVPAAGPRSILRNKIESLRQAEMGSSREKPVDLLHEQQILLNDLLQSADDGDDSDDNIPLSDFRNSAPASIAPQLQPSNSVQAATALSTARHDKYDLETVLKTCVPKGEVVLAAYRSKQRLTDSLRSSLADCIISKEIQGNLQKRISAERAKFLGEQILIMFPKEVLSIWFREEERFNGKGKVHRGRILTRYYNVRRELIKAGVLSTTSNDESRDEESMDSDIDDEGLEESMAWLKGSNLTPWTRVLTAWTATSKQRRRHLIAAAAVEKDAGSKRRRVSKRTTEEKVLSYMAEFPQIKERQGWTLLELDFELYQPSAILKLTSDFGKFSKFVLDKLRDKSDYLLDDEMSNSERCARIFLSFSKLFPVTTIASINKNKNGRNWRPSRAEIRDSFLLHVKSEADLKQVLNDRRNKLQEFNLTCQPIPVIIGASLDKIDKCYVVVDSWKYEVETPLKAVDVAFKTYHSLHASYPPESEPLWLFLQLAIYKFSTKWDRSYDSVELLVAEYTTFAV